MKVFSKKNIYLKIALALSICALIVWVLLGTGASLAWFADTSPELNNIFHFADFEVTVSHRLDNGDWEKIESDTVVFDEEALYEPGYTQAVYLKIQNTGTREFRYKTAVSTNGYTIATNVFGQRVNLQEYLKFGLVTADTEAAMDAAVADRETAAAVAVTDLNNYHETDEAMLLPNEEAYAVLIVRMPEDVGNLANYRGDIEPTVDLCLIVTAEQATS